MLIKAAENLAERVVAPRVNAILPTVFDKNVVKAGGAGDKIDCH